MSARTIIDKIWDAHQVRAETDATPGILYVDLHLIHEVTSPQAFAEHGDGRRTGDVVAAVEQAPGDRRHRDRVEEARLHEPARQVQGRRAVALEVERPARRDDVARRRSSQPPGLLQRRRQYAQPR